MLQEVYLDLFNSLWHERIIKAYESDTGWINHYWLLLGECFESTI